MLLLSLALGNRHDCQNSTSLCKFKERQDGCGFRLQVLSVKSMRVKSQVKKHIDPLWLFFIWSQSSPAEKHGCPGNKLNREEGQRAGGKELTVNIRAHSKPVCVLYTAPASPVIGPLGSP